MSDGLTIGEFSRITHLSVKALRRYHESGLLEPASVDAHSGYRRYSLDQVPTAQLIHRFRDLDMPLSEIAQVVSTPDPTERAALIRTHLERLERQLDSTRAAVSSLRRLLDPSPPPVEMALRHHDAHRVAAISEIVDSADILDWYSAAMSEIDRALVVSRTTPTGPPAGLYDNELFTDGRGRMTVYIPADDPPTRGRVHSLGLDAADRAVTVHRGAHDDIDITYGQLGRHLTEQGLAIAGPVQEVYLCGPRDTDDNTRWRTEIGWPVLRVESSPI
ncbi:MerR family transcriptional regulator [Williamsia sp.]|uniref:MerR family transcriptional regulator n=1 Tax=Williamsia sp. TaxID=1872085 RepID=UPI001A1DDE60|nr:MerR family transcriptional regulator [Williamsia sp.]MBJ7291082.1 MerR family transcriptional regulator [Williamsia sp.]